MQARLIATATFGPSAGDLAGSTASIGTIINRPDCWQLVEAGIAVPHDNECAEKTGRPLVTTPEEEQRLQHVYRRTELGILPEDHAAFDAGEMVGYEADGSWIPGPNYVAPDDESDGDSTGDIDDVHIDMSGIGSTQEEGGTDE